MVVVVVVVLVVAVVAVVVLLVVLALSFGAMLSQCLAQVLRHLAMSTSWSKVSASGASIQMLPGSPISHCMRTASLTRRRPSFVSSSLSMCPSH